MADYHPHKTHFLNTAHLPTWMLAIGYPVYWLELYVLKADRGVTSWLAWAIFGLIAAVLMYRDRREAWNFLKEFITRFKNLKLLDRILIGGGLSFVIVILGVAV